MERTDVTARRLQRALNALARGSALPRLPVNGRSGRRTLAVLIRFLAAHGPAGEARLVRAMRALDRPPMATATIRTIRTIGD